MPLARSTTLRVSSASLERLGLLARVGELGAARLGGRDRGEHVVLPERLDEVAEGACLARLLHDVALGERGHHDDRDLTLGEDAPRRLDAVELGHAHVHEDDVGLELAGQAHRLGAVARLADDRQPRALEQLAEIEPDDRFVFADQYSHPRTLVEPGDGAASAHEREAHRGAHAVVLREAQRAAEVDLDEGARDREALPGRSRSAAAGPGRGR